MEQSLSIFKAICLLYQDLYRQLSLNTSFIYKPSRNDKITIIKFIGWLRANYLKEQIGEDFLILYFKYQFYRYAGIQTPKGRNMIMMNWIVGAKAISAWQDRNPKLHYKVNFKIKRELQLTLLSSLSSLKSFRVNNNNQLFILKIHVYEEVEKEKYYNTTVGFVYCAQMTTLFNEKSVLCNGCKFQQDCIKRLKTNYPRIYRARLPNGANTTAIHT